MKFTHAMNLSYIFDAARKGAKYSLDGTHWMNGGEFMEAAAKAVHGLDPYKDKESMENG